jgi:hypothetical protein
MLGQKSGVENPFLYDFLPLFGTVPHRLEVGVNDATDQAEGITYIL